MECTKDLLYECTAMKKKYAIYRPIIVGCTLQLRTITQATVPFEAFM